MRENQTEEKGIRLQRKRNRKEEEERRRRKKQQQNTIGMINVHAQQKKKAK